MDVINYWVHCFFIFFYWISSFIKTETWHGEGGCIIDNPERNEKANSSTLHRKRQGIFICIKNETKGDAYKAKIIIIIMHIPIIKICDIREKAHIKFTPWGHWEIGAGREKVWTIAFALIIPTKAIGATFLHQLWPYCPATGSCGIPSLSPLSPYPASSKGGTAHVGMSRQEKWRYPFLTPTQPCLSRCCY